MQVGKTKQSSWDWSRVTGDPSQLPPYPTPRLCASLPVPDTTYAKPEKTLQQTVGGSEGGPGLASPAPAGCAWEREPCPQGGTFVMSLALAPSFLAPSF